MLTHIHIRDFAIIKELELELGTGMCVLTGETGAGKSILVDAMGLVLGDRADSTMIRHGADKAEITMTLDIREMSHIAEWLRERDIEVEDECLLRRVLTAEGRSKAYINGTATPLAMIKSLGEMLVDIHGQHEHQSLLRRDMQRELLDTQAGNGELLKQLNTHYVRWQQLKRLHEAASKDKREQQAKLDLLRFQVDELKTLGLQANELETLDAEHQRLSNAGQLQQGSFAVFSHLYENDDNTIYSQINSLQQQLDELCTVDDSLSESRDLLANAQVQIQEAADNLRRYADSIEIDDERLQWVENRISAIHDLGRKHRIKPEELPQKMSVLTAELASLENPQHDPAKLEAELKQIENKYRALATKISKARIKTAEQLNNGATEIMQELGMEGGRFRIQVIATDVKQISPTGLDKVEFMVSTNPGQPFKPLNKIASGGELSRISLAIQLMAVDSMNIPTLIFDEVDSGVGGGVAEILGRQLRELGQHRQTLCVTHLPQVAAQAHHHYHVSKLKGGKTTRTQIRPLNEFERVKELARMLGGVKLTDQTLAHAQEMFARGQNVKTG